MDVDYVPRSRLVRLPTNKSIMDVHNTRNTTLKELSPQKIPYVIYRNSKYNGFLRRFNQYFIIYSRFYILQPLLIRINQFHIYLLEFLGFLILLFASPFLICSACVLYLIRRIRVTLLKKFYPNLIICEDLSPRGILAGKSHGMVTAVVWTHGKITLQTLRSELAPFKNTILQKKLTDKFGLRVWSNVENIGTEYDIYNHIIESPSKFYKVNLNDEDSYQSQKSSLQKFVTSCASKILDPEKPPWEITLIPQSSFNKEKTCCVLRFHYLLLKDKYVRRFLGDIFTQNMKSIKFDDFNYDDDQIQNIIQSNSEEPMKIILSFITIHWKKLKNWVQNNFIVTSEDFKTYITLRQKQWEFHSKSTLIKLKLFEIVFKVSSIILILQSICWYDFWIQMKQVILALFVLLRALCYIPIEIIDCLSSINPVKNGIQRAGKPETRQVAWSPPISKDLLEAIQEKTNAKLDSVILTACSLALKDYYDETSLKNPKSLCVSVPNISEDLLAPTGFKVLQLSTEKIQLPNQLNKVNIQLEEYPTWKILGSYYILTNVSYLLPRAIAYLVLKNLFKRYPITFTYVDLDPLIPLPVILPTMSLWGQAVDEFIFWRSPQSDFCVSITLVRYLETRRLAVISPMKTIDRTLTKYFGKYLNRIAESLGVNKLRIPYSRRSSPSSSYCSSPSINLNEVTLRNKIFTKR